VSDTVSQRVEIAIVATVGLAVTFALGAAVRGLHHPLALALGSMVAIAVYLAPRYGWHRWQVSALFAAAIGLIALFAIQPSYTLGPLH
jgi:hypothetical protein